MFAKILIANRGEIACRVIRTARRMGIATVVVYSDADADALHVRMADEACPIGPAPAAESYLVIERIVAAARETGAQAVHPGYGFLAENPAFVAALDAAEIVFIGPGAEAIAAMGDKLESKRIARQAGVRIIPGHDGILADAEAAVAAARVIGYPVMLKASAGGGGKGMRIARDDDETREGFRAASSEAKSSFGDDRVLIEKFIEQPRHIEIQVLADAHGNAIQLGERECSIQRRHQKVIEEAPSPFIGDRTRAAMGAQAVALARAVGYRSAGTVEFIVDTNKEFYFLEMNTRLQVEHPVTELVTGVDLVEQMIRIATGEKLALRQDEVRRTGWAIEGRIYAEEPTRGFLPSSGRLTRFRPPPEADGLRLDTGVYEGAEVSVFYDPMIAKLCAFGADRDEAIARLSAALDRFEIHGPGQNLGFLAAMMRHPCFQEGRLSTGFIAEEYGEVFAGVPVEGEVRDALLAVAVLAHLRDVARDGRAFGHSEWVASLADANYPVTVAGREDGLDLRYDGQSIALGGDWRPGESLFAGTVDGRAVAVQIARYRAGYRLRHAGAEVIAFVRRPREAELAALMPAKAAGDSSRYLLSPMPGRVVSIAVEAGQDVKAGEALAVVDAMKMENVLRAERDGRIARIVAGLGDSLSADQVILEFE
ncbi:MAG: acetyl-CoA carboxylase biotin carboxylase subunit [Alphaproteobacteria bacterium]